VSEKYLIFVNVRKVNVRYEIANTAVNDSSSEKEKDEAAKRAQSAMEEIMPMYQKGTWYKVSNIRVMKANNTDDLELVYNFSNVTSWKKDKRE
jgi:hypothetical protein